MNEEMTDKLHEDADLSKMIADRYTAQQKRLIISAVRSHQPNTRKIVDDLKYHGVIAESTYWKDVRCHEAVQAAIELSLKDATDKLHDDCEKAKGDQLQHIISDDEFCKMNKVGEQVMAEDKEPQAITPLKQWKQARQRLRDMKRQADDLDYFKSIQEQIHYLLNLADNIIDRQAEQLKAKDKAIALLNSMVCGGESHSDHSRQTVSEALKGK